MDPNANIARQRELAKSIADMGDSIQVYETGKPMRALWHYAPELAELVLALDEWRRKGGHDRYHYDMSEVHIAIRTMVVFIDNILGPPQPDESRAIFKALATVDR